MTTGTPFSITTNGEILPGFDPEAVSAAFVEMFGCTPEKAAEFIYTSKLVKKNLTKDQAEMYKTNLAEIGLSATVEGSVGIEDMFSLVGDEPEPEAADTPMSSSDYSASIAKITPTMSKNETCCPKCKLVQPKGTECRACGIIYSRYSPANDPGVRIKERRVKKDRRLPIRIKSEPNMGSFFLPVVAALLGVLVWALVAKEVGGPLGVMAWGIGSAIGLAATFAGCGNRKVAGYCGLVALVAIVVGKFLATVIKLGNAPLELAEEVTAGAQATSESAAGLLSTIYVDPLQGKPLWEFITTNATNVDLAFLVVGVATAYMTARASEDKSQQAR